MRAEQETEEQHAYFAPNRAETRGLAKAITATVGGITSKEEYFIELLKTIFSVSLSFSASSFEKAGNSMVVMGVAKKGKENGEIVSYGIVAYEKV